MGLWSHVLDAGPTEQAIVGAVYRHRLLNQIFDFKPLALSYITRANEENGANDYVIKILNTQNGNGNCVHAQVRCLQNTTTMTKYLTNQRVDSTIYPLTL